MFSNALGIVLCGGHGFITDSSKAKVVESVFVNGQQIPMVRIPFDILKNGLEIKTVLLVINGRFGEQVMRVIGDNEAIFVSQPTRTGTGGAIELCLPIIKILENRYQRRYQHLVVLYGDMPCFRVKSIWNLLTSHLSSVNKPVISMFSVPAEKFDYGRIIWRNGQIVAVKEPYEMTADDLIGADACNPSAWVYDLKWISRNLCALPWHDKGDGHSREKFLPDLVASACRQKKSINIIPLDDANEAMGVNNMEQYVAVKKYLENRAT